MVDVVQWIVKKAVIAAIAFFAFYLVASTLGILPQNVKDFILWLQGEFNILLLVVCFLVAAYVVIKALSWKQREKRGLGEPMRTGFCLCHVAHTLGSVRLK